VDFLLNEGMIYLIEKREKMSRRPRRNHSPAFKAKVALEAAKGEVFPLLPGTRTVGSGGGPEYSALLFLGFSEEGLQDY
jgi:hypothetical protein